MRFFEVFVFFALGSGFVWFSECLGTFMHFHEFARVFRLSMDLEPRLVV